MTVSVKSNRANAKCFRDIARAPGTIRQGIRAGMYTVGGEDVRHVRRLINDPPKSGRIYGTHQASAPGEAPANRSGELARSADFVVRGTSQIEVGESAPYAGYLEKGTLRPGGGTLMEPRPHLDRTRIERTGEAFITLSEAPFRALTGKRVK